MAWGQGPPRNKPQETGGHKERKAVENRRTGKRSNKERCPCCKKLRVRFIRANAVWLTKNPDGSYDGAKWGNRKMWGTAANGQKRVCWLCLEREATATAATPAAAAVGAAAVPVGRRFRWGAGP